MPAAEQGVRSLQSLVDDCGRVNHGMLQWLTKCLTPWSIDRAVTDMLADSQGGPQLATYARYNVLLETAWLKDKLAIDRSRGRGCEGRTRWTTRATWTSSPGSALAAKVQVKPEHFHAGLRYRVMPRVPARRDAPIPASTRNSPSVKFVTWTR